MKLLIIAALLLCSLGAFSQTSRYKPGFRFYDNDRKVTLLKFIDVGMGHFRWKAQFELLGVKAIGFTDDCWIDLYTGKCFLDERRHKIVYYDSLEKWYPDYVTKIKNL